MIWVVKSMQGNGMKRPQRKAARPDTIGSFGRMTGKGCVWERPMSGRCTAPAALMVDQGPPQERCFHYMCMNYQPCGRRFPCRFSLSNEERATVPCKFCLTTPVLLKSIRSRFYNCPLQLRALPSRGARDMRAGDSGQGGAA